MKIREFLQQKREDILQIADQHGAFNVRIFGSVARGEETENSDIDFLIDYDVSKISPWFPVGLIEDLEQILNRSKPEDILAGICEVSFCFITDCGDGANCSLF